LVANVANEICNTHAHGLYLCSRCAVLVGVRTPNSYVCTPARKPPRHAEANAPVTARNQGHFASKVENICHKSTVSLVT
jgi:hypothetical protein